MVCGELRTFDGGLPLDLRIRMSPVAGMVSRQGKQEIASNHG